MENKVTLEQIKGKITDECYLVLPDGKSTLCILTLENGYTIKGLSACVDASNFNMDAGRKIAYENAIDQIWPLEGYLLAEKLYWDRAVPVASNPPISALDEERIVAEFDVQYKKWKATAKKTARRPAAKKTTKKRAAGYGLKKDGTPKAKPGRKTAK